MPERSPHRTSARSRLLARQRERPEDLSALRELLVGPEQVRLDALEGKLPTPETLGAILPEALAHAAQVRTDDLTTAIARPLTGALRDVARREPDALGEIFAPAIGTAVRRAVKDAFTAILQRFNQLLEQSLSLNSLRWRIEAARTGRPFSEVLLSHTLIYRVEWVVLVHSETSLVLEQAAAPEAIADAPDQVSAMLQAIGTFVSEAFQGATPGGALQTIEVGDLAVWIERDPAVTLAAAIRGVPPVDLRETLRQTLERIRTLHHEHIPNVLPEPTTFADTRPLLEDCLKQRMRPQGKRAQWVLAIAGIAVLLAIGAAAVRATDRDRRDAELRAAYRSTLASAPGIVVTSVDRAGDGYRIRGLRDPRAETPEQLIASHGLPLALLDFAPFDSLDPHFERPIVAADVAIRALEQVTIRFRAADASVSPSDPALERAADLIGRAQRAAARSQLGLCVEVFGHTDETGAVERNESLRSARAQSVAAALEREGVDRTVLEPRASDPLLAMQGRIVTFRALLRPEPQRGGCRP